MFCVMGGMTYSLLYARYNRPVKNATGEDSDKQAEQTTTGKHSTNIISKNGTVKISKARQCLARYMMPREMTQQDRHGQSIKLDDMRETSTTESAALSNTTQAVSLLPGGQVANWAQSLDKLLEDPAGLHTFSEFLKSQFSHENIFFWVACRRYRFYPEDKRAQAAKAIFRKHLSDVAPEPINIEGTILQEISTNLQHAESDLFDKAEEAIYKLMMYDCYPRFLKSTMFEDCVFLERSREPMPYQGDESMHEELRLPLTE